MTGLVAAVVLAAGEASRFGAPKQLLLLPEVLARLDESVVDEIVVVEGAHDLAGACDDPTRAPCRVVRCPDWALGPGASLRCGLAQLADDVDAAVVVLADGPDLAPEQSPASSMRGGPKPGMSLRPPTPVLEVIRCSSPAQRGPASPTQASVTGCRASCRATTSDRPETSTAPATCPNGSRQARTLPRPETSLYSASAPRSCASFSISPGGIRSTALRRTYMRRFSSKR